MIAYVCDGKKAEELYERFSKVKGPWADRLQSGGKEAFLNDLTESWFLLEFPFGIVRVTDYVPDTRVVVHALFDSPKVFGAKDELRDAAYVLLHVTGVRRVECLIPEGRKPIERLLEAANFKREGLLRKAYFDGKIWGNKVMYSLIKEDFDGE